MAWEVEYTDEFEAWWNELPIEQQTTINTAVILLEDQGPHLEFPHCSEVKASRHSRMRELRIQIQGRPFRVLYAFNPKRAAILLLGGDKTGDDRWYEVNVPIADRLYENICASWNEKSLRRDWYG